MNTQDISVLIVEDEPFVAKDIEHKLNSLGYPVSGVVDNALDAINHIALHQPDLVLMDIVLPGDMDGIQTAEAIRGLHIPIIYLSAHYNQALLDRAKITDPMAYIIKPASKRDLHAAISIALQKAENEKQRHEKELLDATLVSLADALLAWDLKGKIIRVNRALLNLMHLDEQDLIGHDITTAIKFNNATDGLDVTEKLVYLIESQGNCKEDWDLILQCTPEPIAVRIRGSHILNQNIHCLGYAMLIRDDTERKQQEYLTRESEARFQQLAGHIESIFYLEDIQTHQIIYLSPAYKKIYGALPPAYSEASPSLFLNQVHPNDQSKINTFIQAINEPRKCTAISRIIRPDGEIRWIKIRGYPIQNEQGKVYRMACVIDDVTENTQAEIKLQQAAKVFENTSEGVLITDAQLKVVAINQAFSKITGYSEHEALGTTPKILQSGQQSLSFYETMWQAINNDGHWQGEVINQRSNGETYPQWMTINAIQDPDGEILNYISVFSDITHIKQSQKELEFLAHHDSLTGFANRLLFNARLEHSIEQAARSNELVVILLMDLDRFKEINDNLGHDAGDSLLILVAERLRACLREEDTLARLGGDEFIFILEDIKHLEEIHFIIQKIQSLFVEPFTIHNREIIITASIGISLYPKDGSDVPTLIKNADRAMYKAKQRGRNGYAFYAEELNIDNMKRLLLATEMRQGLERGEFLVYYQPQVCLINNVIIGAEALIRWQHPEQGFMSPLDFIPLAEETGFIEKLGEWVLHTACQQCKLWHDQGYQDFVIAVNLSAKQFLFTEIVETVKTVLHQTGLPGRYLELEITESGLMDSADKIISELGALKSLGVSLSIDDFGTGYSSLSYLKRFPIDKLKIDQSFVKDLPDDEQDASIARSIIALGKSMGLIIIAEGVEHEAQRDFMITEGCSLMQGYLFSRPVTADDFDKLLQKEAALKSSI